MCNHSCNFILCLNDCWQAVREVYLFFVHSKNPKLLGVTVKDSDTVGYTFFLYKCSVENYECEVSCENLVA